MTADSRIYYLYEDSQWGDLLTSYNGKTITYDEIGNPLSDGTWTYTWAQGRQLTKMQSGSVVCNYTYDADGLRTSRSYGTANYTYRYVDGKLTQMVASSGGTMHFTYGTDGRPLSITYGGANYYYVLNLQGDVVAILDSTGALVVEYVYDAWGRVLSPDGELEDSLGLHNPLRYRGYVYDRETGLYYLQSRYYNPNTGRFINADGIVSSTQSLSGNNLFSYCNNNPVNFTDTTGEFPWLAIGIAVVASIVIIGIDHVLAASKPEGYEVYNETKESVHKRGIYAEGNGFEIDANGVTVCDLKAGLFEAKLEGNFLSVDAVNVFTGSAIAELDWSGSPELDVSAVASIYSPGLEATLPLGIFDITISAEVHLGGVGVGIELDPNSGRFRITPPLFGIGGSFGIDFDLNI